MIVKCQHRIDHHYGFHCVTQSLKFHLLDVITVDAVAKNCSKITIGNFWSFYLGWGSDIFLLICGAIPEFDFQFE